MLSYDPLGRVLKRLSITPTLAFVYGVIILGLIEQIIIPLIGNYFTISNSDPAYISNRISAIVNAFIITPIVWAYYVWTTKYPHDVYLTLKSSQVIPENAADRFSSWFKEYESSLGNKKTAVVVYILTIAFVSLVNYGWLKVDPWFGRGNWFAYSYAFIMFSIAYMMTSWIIIRELITVYWLRKLFSILDEDLVIQISYPDNAGGLGVIGLHASRLSMLIVAIGSFLVSVTLVSNLYNVAESAWSITQITLWGAYIIFVPLSFGLLILPAHNYMQRYKNKQLLQVSRLIQGEVTKLKSIKQLNHDTTQNILKEIETLQKAYEYLDKSIPVWPFSAAIFRGFTFTSLIPILSLFGSLFIDYITK